MNRLLPLPLLLILVSSVAMAQKQPAETPQTARGAVELPGPRLPAKTLLTKPVTRVQGDQDSQENAVVVKKRGRNIVTEYRAFGRVIMVKIQPPVGPAYYYVSRDGITPVGVRHVNNDVPNLQQWTLFSWD